MKWRPQFEDLVSIRRDAGGLSIVHSRVELVSRVRLLAAALVVLAWALLDRSDPLLLVLLVTAWPTRRMESMHITRSGFDFTGGPSFTREEFLLVRPTGDGALSFEFRGGVTRSHFRRLSEIQAARITEAISSFAGLNGGPASHTPASA